MTDEEVDAVVILIIIVLGAGALTGVAVLYQLAQWLVSA